jgi:hypothetical protein
LEPTATSQPGKACAINSGPLSDRICVGMPRRMHRSERRSITSVDLSCRLIRIAKHSRVNSSMTFSVLYFLPSCARSSTKAYDHTLFGYSDRKRMQDPSLSHSRPRFGYLLGTLSPSRRQILTTRLALTHQPLCRSIAVIRR